MEQKKVKWKVNLFKADPMKCYEEIGDNGITPQEIVEKARDENSELHKCFEWDDTIAAEKYRIQQAKTILLNLVVINIDKEETPRRVYQISSQKNVYQPVKFFLQNSDEYSLLLKRAKEELIAIRKRYAEIAELETVFEAIDSL